MDIQTTGAALRMFTEEAGLDIYLLCSANSSECSAFEG